MEKKLIANLFKKHMEVPEDQYILKKPLVVTNDRYIPGKHEITRACQMMKKNKAISYDNINDQLYDHLLDQEFQHLLP